jgi:dTDP-4-dehydrorhamnose reductase
MSEMQVIGATGMLGQAVCEAIQDQGHTVVIVPVDIRHVTPRAIQAPVVINCAGLVKQREASRLDLLRVNAEGPLWLAAACGAADSRLIHVSTDCVFTRPGPHDELAPCDLDDDYALTKRLGEVTHAPHLTLRTSFVGWSKRGLLHDLATQPAVRASRRLLWSGHTVNTVARFLVLLATDAAITGLLHMPGTFQSRWMLVQALCRHYDLPATIIDDPSFEADRRLISRRWWDLQLPQILSFPAQLEQMERPA